jgi:16S rRNA (guanine966-N2)-methyltransferase
MRVIGGTFGGRRLKAVEGHVTRPTSDRVREALFSRLEARYGLEGATILDVFSGTGALAIEAVSRGAARATCIELERRALDTLRANVRSFDLADNVRIIADDYRKVLVRIASTPTANGRKRRFHGVFVDPPYGKGLALDTLAALAELDLVRFGGWVTVETGRREDLPDAVEGSRSTLHRVREDVYGDTKLALYESHETSETRSQPPGEKEAPAAEVDR